MFTPLQALFSYLCGKAEGKARLEIGVPQGHRLVTEAPKEQGPKDGYGERHGRTTFLPFCSFEKKKAIPRVRRTKVV